MRWVLVCAACVSLTVCPESAQGDGIFDAITGSVEATYNFVSLKTTDQAGNTTKTEINGYRNLSTLNVNYNFFPKLNLNTGVSFERTIADPVGDESTIRKTDAMNIRPYIWLTLRDPIYTAALGYDFREETLRTSGFPTATLMQQSYNASLNWKPEGFPQTEFRYTGTNTQDGAQSFLDTTEDYFFLKSRYLYKGLEAYYTGNYRDTRDKVRDFETTAFSNEGRLIYSTTLFNGRTSLSSDNRVNVTTTETTTPGPGQVAFPVFPFAGLSSLDDTPVNDALSPNPALIDGNLTASAGVNIGVPALGGDTRQRNIGIDFQTAVDLNSLQVWVDRTLPFEISSTYAWDIYTSTDNLNWALYRTLPTAPFGPFLNRFELSFPTVRTRYIKAVTRPLSPAVIVPPGFANPDQIFVTEIEAFRNQPAQDVKGSTTQLFQNYTLDARTLILNTPNLYYNFNAYYTSQSNGNTQQQYNVSNGLFLNYGFTPKLSTSANASIEFGSEQDQSRVAFLYYASLLATPLRTLSNNLVFSGNNQVVGGLSNYSNTVALYNNAQLYKGIDANLNLGLALTSNEQDVFGTLDRRSYYINVGTNINPRPDLTLTLYYLWRTTHASGGSQGLSGDSTEQRLDIGASWSPFRSLFLSANVNIVSQTGAETNVQQNYGLSWTPFPDGQLQFSFFYSDSYYPDRSSLLQPTLRWYFATQRRSYIDVSYQWRRSEAGGLTTEANVIGSTLKIYF